MQRLKRRAEEEGNVFLFFLREEGEGARGGLDFLLPLYFFLSRKKTGVEPKTKILLSREPFNPHNIAKRDHALHSEPFRMLLLRSYQKTGAQNDLARLQVGTKSFPPFRA